MMNAEVADEFPVVLYDGERKINVGNIEIHPTLNFQQFRTALKQMIGISYNNLITYLVDNKKSSRMPLEKRKILITSKVDFSVIVQESKNAYFLVVLKRSRRDRRRKPNNSIGLELYPADLFDIGFNNQDITSKTPTFVEKVESWLHGLQMQRENNIEFMIQNPSPDEYSHMIEEFPSITEAYPVVERSEIRTLCEDCTLADRWGWKPIFHFCVYDDVAEGSFRSPVGPISRPK